jgi:competence protein ComEA
MVGGGSVNGTEKFAGFLLIVTLTIGVVADLAYRHEGHDSVTIAAEQGASLADRSTGIAYRRVNVNTATPDELLVLPGIGPKRAEALVQWRDKNGPFCSLSDLLEVRGIGQRTLDRISPYVWIGRQDSLQHE